MPLMWFPGRQFWMSVMSVPPSSLSSCHGLMVLWIPYLVVAPYGQDYGDPLGPMLFASMRVSPWRQKHKVYRDELQKSMKTIKENFIDIAHASHHLDLLKQAETTGRLPGGMMSEPKTMIWKADDETIQEWKDQTRKNTLGYMGVAKQAHTKAIQKGTKTISDTQA